MKSGKVYIAGAGPGDCRLISIRTDELIREADVIIYDRLADKNILRKSKYGCELIYVGKEPGFHVSEQIDINLVLIEKALEFKKVLRLKGGDPFIFGRGGEEAEALFDNNIEFEIIPGISSFYSACAYAGIPVTHRDYASSVHVITGHLKTGTELDYKVISQMEGTLIFLMGMKNIEKICRGLIENDKNKNTPAAVIQWGTTYKQKCVKGTLNDICNIVKSENITNPSIIIVGDVVKAEGKINWQRYRPLWGKRVLITRTSDVAGEICNSLYELGADAVEFPTIKIGEADYTDIDKYIKNINCFTWIFFTSVNGVNSFFKRLKQNNVDIRCLNGIKIFCIGERTKSAVEDRLIIVDKIPEHNNSIEAAEEVGEFIKSYDSVLFPTSEIAGENLSNAILSTGALCKKVSVYTNTINGDYDYEIVEETENGGFDAIVFASSSQVKNFVEITGGRIGSAKICTIGKMTTATCKKLGMRVNEEAETPNVEGLVDAVLRALK